jgi:hypothetical protein
MVMGLALAACGRQSAAPPAAATPASTPQADARGALALLPPAGTPPGWTRSKAPQSFGPDNLWEFIDGAAETYLAFLFQEAVTAGYSRGGAEVTVEVYRMADALHAYGIYMQEIAPAASFVATGAEGYVNGNVLNFWKGACYVKITAPAVDRPGADQLSALARAVADRVPDAGPLPVELASFPADHLAPHSIRYIPKDVLGQGYFTNGFEASYKDGPKDYRLVVVCLGSAQDATAALARYRSFVGGSGRLRPGRPTAGDAGFAGDDQLHGGLLAVRSGPRILVVLGAPSDAVASALASGFLARVPTGAHR